MYVQKTYQMPAAGQACNIFSKHADGTGNWFEMLQITSQCNGGINNEAGDKMFFIQL